MYILLLHGSKLIANINTQKSRDKRKIQRSKRFNSISANTSMSIIKSCAIKLAKHRSTMFYPTQRDLLLAICG